jgi:AcrR family transcriptional regulator
LYETIVLNARFSMYPLRLEQMTTNNGKNHKNTKQRILDSAEHLFARNGYHGTSIRAITKEAGVNLAAINYHFGSKEALVQEMFARKLAPVNKIPMDRLEKVLERAEKKGCIPVAGDILRAFIEPTFEFVASDSGRNLPMLIGRAMMEPDGTLKDIFLKNVEPLFIRYLAAFCLAFPELSQGDIFLRFLFSMGSMLRAMHSFMWPEAYPPELNLDLKAEELVEKLISFTAAGMEAP